MAAPSECMREVDVEVPAGEVEREATRVASGIQRRARIAGFRPGKAPLSLVKQHFSAKIREETLETLVPAHLRAAYERENLQPVSTPTLSGVSFEPGQALKFKASFEVMPAIELGDYKAIRAGMPTLEISDEDLEKGIESLRDRHSHLESSDATEAADGLVAVVEARNAGEPAPADEDAAQRNEVAIGVGDPNTLPEFTSALQGMKIGGEREIEVSYPGDFPDKAMAGQSRRYHLQLKRIQVKVLPELTDPAITEVIGTTTAEEARQWVRERMEAERKHEARHQVEEQVMQDLMGLAQFPVPQALVDKRIEDRIERNLYGLSRQGVDLRKLQLDWGKLRERHMTDAEREVRASLLLEKVAEAEKLEATAADLEEEIGRAATELGQSPDAVRARLTENGALAGMQEGIRRQKALAWLLDNATGGAFGRNAVPAQETAKEQETV